MRKNVFFFGDGRADGASAMRVLLGGKGANLAEMTSLGIPVPPGFTITTEVCREFYTKGGAIPRSIKEEALESLAAVEAVMKKSLGGQKPLLVSVRSGSPVSMPGMMDTVLNIGLNDDICRNLSLDGGERFAYDAYRRLVQMFGRVVMGVDGELFEKALQEEKAAAGVQHDSELTPEQLKRLVAQFKSIVEEKAGRPFPDDPTEQLWMATEAVFRSWMGERAVAYRNIYGLDHNVGTAVNVVAMVYGNRSEDSGTGVLFTRNPNSGEKGFYGEYLMNAQGEDVVAGVRTPKPLCGEPGSLMEEMPGIYSQLEELGHRLERHYADMQDIEFTVERARLWILQTRSGKRTPRAAVRIAVDMQEEGTIDVEEALLRVEPEQVEMLLHPMIEPGYKGVPVGKGIAASPGAATGSIVFDPAEAERQAAQSARVVLVRVETSPEDIKGMHASVGILTTRGGKTSHAAVVARGMGKPAVVGAEQFTVDYSTKTLTVDGRVLNEGDVITIDGGSGSVYEGDVPKIDPALEGELYKLLAWADKIRRMKVRANADTPEDALNARQMGAQGIGLTRTEHMFFQPERIRVFRELILLAPERRSLKAEQNPSDETLWRLEQVEKRFNQTLRTLQEFQKEDFKGILKAMAGLPVTIRLLDPPLHEFLPDTDEQIETLARDTGHPVPFVRALVESLQETNPMLGHRGVRLAVTFEGIYESQTRAICEAAAELRAEGTDAQPEIMIPLVAFDRELIVVRERVEKVIREVEEERAVRLDIPVGTMIELPRAALTADRIAKVADFFSFGTNDLTQTALGISRDDVGKFVAEYIKEGIFSSDPFQTIDEGGVGSLVRMAAARGRKANPRLTIGICGEHGGDPRSVQFFDRAGLDYVSCSPYRVPVARMAAARATVLRSRLGEADLKDFAV